MNSQSIKAILIVVGAAMVALWLGVSVVTNQTETLLKVVGAAFLIVCALLGRRIWLLFILMVSLDIPLIRGINTTEIGQAAFFGFSLMLIAIRKLPLRPRFGELEVWMFLVALSIVQAYVRNPVGLNIFGAGAVGGRPYAVAGISLMTGWLLSMMIVPPQEIKWASTLTFVGRLFGAPLTDLRSNAGMAAQGIDVGESRVPWVGNVSILLLRWIVSRISPFAALLRPLYFLLLVIAVCASAASGYRNVVAAAGLVLIFGVYYHKGLPATILAAVAAAACIAFLSLVNVLVPLPGTMQRALSPFPGTWEERYVRDASHSTDWRVEMWKQALFTDHWIKDKVFGDGLGMTREELDRLQELSFGSKELNRNVSTGLTIQQENMMLTGSYHSGPVQSVRTVGYVGMTIIILAMFRLAAHCHRLIKRARGTEWFQPILFLLLPAIIYPIQFVFIYGDFKTAMSLVFLSFGLCRLIGNNIALPEPIKRMAYVPQGPRSVRPMQPATISR